MKAHRPARVIRGSYASSEGELLVEVEVLVECKIETSLAIFALDEGERMKY